VIVDGSSGKEFKKLLLQLNTISDEDAKLAKDVRKQCEQERNCKSLGTPLKNRSGLFEKLDDVKFVNVHKYLADVIF